MIWSNQVIRIIYNNLLLKILEASRAAAIFAVFIFGPFLISLHSFEFNIGLFNFLQSCQSLEWFLKSSIHRFQISSFARITVYIHFKLFLKALSGILFFSFFKQSLQLNPGSFNWKINSISSTTSHTSQNIV